MKRSLNIALLGAAVGLLSACSTFPAAHRAGLVANVSGSELQLCFDSRVQPPAAGQQVQLFRRQHAGNLKSGRVFRERLVATVQVVGEASGGCTTATLIRDSARQDDEVRLLATGRRPH